MDDRQEGKLPTDIQFKRRSRRDIVSLDLLKILIASNQWRRCRNRKSKRSMIGAIFSWIAHI
jgi:hypothetical protein